MNVNGNEYYPTAEGYEAESLSRYTAKTFGPPRRDASARLPPPLRRGAIAN